MSKWVVRNDCATHQIGEPRECFDPKAMDGRFDLLSIEEAVRSLIGPDEMFIGSSSSRLVMRGAKLVGYIQICDTSPQSEPRPPSVDRLTAENGRSG